MPRLSQRQFARRAAVSQPAISQALRAGLLAVDDDRRLDPDHPRNRHYLGLHAAGLDHRGHAVRPDAVIANGNALSPNGAAPPLEPELPPVAVPSHDPTAPPVPEAAAASAPAGLFDDWAALSIDVAKADVLLALVEAHSIGFLVAMLEGLRSASAERLAALGKRLDAVEAEAAALRRRCAPL